MAKITVSEITDKRTGLKAKRFTVRIYVGRDDKHNPIQKDFTFATRREAERANAKGAAGLATGADSKTKLGDYLKEWLDSRARRVRPITMEGYRYLVKHCIADTPIAQQPLHKLTPKMVQAWIDAMPLPSTARKARAVLNIALNEAARLEVLPSNPVSRTTAPTQEPRVGKAWTAEELKRFLAKAADDL